MTQPHSYNYPYLGQGKSILSFYKIASNLTIHSKYPGSILKVKFIPESTSTLSTSVDVHCLTHTENVLTSLSLIHKYQKRFNIHFPFKVKMVLYLLSPTLHNLVNFQNTGHFKLLLLTLSLKSSASIFVCYYIHNALAILRCLNTFSTVWQVL